MPKVFDGKFEDWTTEQKALWALSDICITPRLRQVVDELYTENKALKFLIQEYVDEHFEEAFKKALNSLKDKT